MQKLRKLQLAFVEAILAEKDNEVVEQLIVLGSQPENRLAVYRNNTFSNLTNTLRAVYPIIEKIVGTAFFNHAAQQFLKKRPSISSDLNDYGKGFAEFIDQYEPAKSLPYLVDTAYMEWALEKAYYAPDHPPMLLEQLGTIAPEDYVKLRFVLHPTVSLLHSIYPLQNIWEVHQADYVGDDYVDLDQGETYLLITRRHLKSVVEPLTKAQFTFLKCLSNDEAFTVAVEEALESQSDFDLQSFLIACVSRGDIVDFKL